MPATSCRASRSTRCRGNYRRQEVSYDTTEKPGTIIVDTQNKFLYFVEGDGQAMRYGIGVGREGFEWQGTARIALKREWPTWTPPRRDDQAPAGTGQIRAAAWSRA